MNLKKKTETTTTTESGVTDKPAGAAKTALRFTGLPAGAALHYFAIMPMWLVALIALLPLVLPEIGQAIRWVATRPQLSFYCTYVIMRRAGYNAATARDMANHHAFDDDDIHKLGAAPPPKPSTPTRKLAVTAGKARSSRVRTRAPASLAASSSAETVPDNDPDPPPDPPEPRRGRHLYVVRPDSDGSPPERAP